MPNRGEGPGGPFSPLWASLVQRDIAARDDIAGLTTSADKPRRRPPAHRLAMTRAEAASALGVSINSFERHVQPELRIVRRGKLRLIPVREIERWLEENAEWTLGAP
jgi:hypothetical protein